MKAKNSTITYAGYDYQTLQGKVFPEPGPAMIRTGPSVVVIAFFCSGLALEEKLVTLFMVDVADYNICVHLTGSALSWYCVILTKGLFHAKQ